MWHDYHTNLLTRYTATTNAVNRSFEKVILMILMFHLFEVKDDVKDIKHDKSDGLDNLCNEHYTCKSDIWYVLISTLLIPIVKDKKGDITDGDNYRPIAITCVVSDILELILLDNVWYKLHSTCNQFGLKIGPSTDLWCFALKQTIDYYRSISCLVCIFYLDASKAFDKIIHWTLFKEPFS